MPFREGSRIEEGGFFTHFFTGAQLHSSPLLLFLNGGRNVLPGHCAAIKTLGRITEAGNFMILSLPPYTPYSVDMPAVSVVWSVQS